MTNQLPSCTFCSATMTPANSGQWEQVDVDMFVCPQCRQSVMSRPTTPIDSSKDYYTEEDAARAESYYGAHYQNANSVRRPKD